jgi:hypothetical protein
MNDERFWRKLLLSIGKVLKHISVFDFRSKVQKNPGHAIAAIRNYPAAFGGKRYVRLGI